MWGTKNDRAFFNTAFVNITYLYHISSYDSCTFWMRYCTKLISRGIDWIVKHISYYKTKKKMCDYNFLYFDKIYITYWQVFDWDGIYTLSSSLELSKPRRNYLLNINNLSIPQMYWYDIHFISSIKIFQKIWNRWNITVW